MKNKKNKKGFTLIEILLAIGLIAVGGIAIYSLYETVSSSNDALQESKRLISYLDIIESAMASNNNLNTVSIQFLENYGIDVDTRLGLRQIQQDSTGNLEFNYAQVESKFCTKFATNVLATNSGFNININGSNIDVNNQPINQISGLCAQDLSNIVFSIKPSVSVNTLTNEAAIPAYNYESGNSGSLGGISMNPLTSIPVGVPGSQTTYVATGNGYGFGGVTGNGSPIEIPVNNPGPVDNGDIQVNPNPITPPTSTLPENASIISASIGFKVNDWKKINIFANSINVDTINLIANTPYKVEFSSPLFNLTNNEPVILGEDAEASDELNSEGVSDSNGNWKYAPNYNFDVSYHYRKITKMNDDGSFEQNINEPMNASLKTFLRNTFTTYPIYVDIVDKKSGNTVATKDVKPTIVLPVDFQMKQTRYYGLTILGLDSEFSNGQQIKEIQLTIYRSVQESGNVIQKIRIFPTGEIPSNDELRGYVPARLGNSNIRAYSSLEWSFSNETPNNFESLDNFTIPLGWSARYTDVEMRIKTEDNQWSDLIKRTVFFNDMTDHNN